MQKSFIIALICLLALLHAYGASAATCSFEIRVKTGDSYGAGTDSRVSLEVSAGATGPTLEIDSLKAWGGDSWRNYFERGHLATFHGTGDCLPRSPCKLVLTSSGKGARPDWYVDYVEVVQHRQGREWPEFKRKWDVEQWLGPRHQLQFVRNHC